MRTDWIGGLLAVGLALAGCSPEERPRDAAPEAPDAAVEARTDAPARKDVPAAKAVQPERPTARPEPDPDPQVGVELPEQPVRVPETAPAG